MNLYKFFPIPKKPLTNDENVLVFKKKPIIVDEYERDVFPKPDEVEKYDPSSFKTGH